MKRDSMNYKIVTAKENNATLYKRDHIKDYEVVICQIFKDSAEYDICVCHEDYAIAVCAALNAAPKIIK